MPQPASPDLYRLTENLAPEEWIEAPKDFAGSIPQGCLLDRFEIELTHVGRGRARGTMALHAIHLNQRGIAQAGAIVAFADAVAGWASYTATPGRFATLNLTTSLLRPAQSGDLLVAEAVIVHPGRTTQVVDVEVVKPQGDTPPKAVARFTCTQMVFAAEEKR